MSLFGCFIPRGSFDWHKLAWSQTDLNYIIWKFRVIFFVLCITMKGRQRRVCVRVRACVHVCVCVQIKCHFSSVNYLSHHMYVTTPHPNHPTWSCNKMYTVPYRLHSRNRLCMQSYFTEWDKQKNLRPCFFSIFYNSTVVCRPNQFLADNSFLV